MSELWRFTPTHVGKTAAVAFGSAAVAVHPHARGEDLKLHVVGLIESWFTPTHVGKTASRRPSTAFNPVHPHARGEDAMIFGLKRSSTGSPPRTWGRRSCR